MPVGTTSAQLTSLTDLMATVAAIIGEKLPDNAGEDSFNLLPAYRGEAKEPIRPHLITQAFRGAQTLALRAGAWKYLDHPDSGGNRYDKGELQPYHLPEATPSPVSLYNLDTDPGELKNLAAENPGQVKVMKALLDKLVSEGRSRPSLPQRKEASPRN